MANMLQWDNECGEGSIFLEILEDEGLKSVLEARNLTRLIAQTLLNTGRCGDRSNICRDLQALPADCRRHCLFIPIQGVLFTEQG